MGGGFVLFAALPAVGHLTPLLLQAQALAGQPGVRRIVVSTPRGEGGACVRACVRARLFRRSTLACAAAWLMAIDS